MAIIEKLVSSTDAALRAESLPPLAADVDGIKARSSLIEFDASPEAVGRKEAISQIADALQDVAKQWGTLQSSLAERDRRTKEMSAALANAKQAEAELEQRQGEREAAMSDLDVGLRQAREHVFALRENLDYQRATTAIAQAESDRTVVTLRVDGRKIELATYYAPGDGIIRQDQRTDERLDLALERIGGG